MRGLCILLLGKRGKGMAFVLWCVCESLNPLQHLMPPPTRVPARPRLLIGFKIYNHVLIPSSSFLRIANELTNDV